MASIVIPYRGSDAKSRLGPDRRELARAMLRDVLAASRPVGRTRLAERSGGQAAAVVSALAGIEGPVAVVNADLPCVTPADLEALLAAAPALVAAADGTTNALALPVAAAFRPLYGPGSAERFSALGLERLDLPNLADDVDTLADLERVADRVGAHTRAVLETVRVQA